MGTRKFIHWEPCNPYRGVHGDFRFGYNRNGFNVYTDDKYTYICSYKNQWWRTKTK